MGKETYESMVFCSSWSYRWRRGDHVRETITQDSHWTADVRSVSTVRQGLFYTVLIPSHPEGFKDRTTLWLPSTGLQYRMVLFGSSPLRAARSCMRS